jgi:3-hydroxyisobutyrate dehydrogenase-like beta-hydroxyacid dehydrogenase
VDVAIIGLGNMGMAYVGRLVELGHRVFGYDVSDEALSQAAGMGAVPLRSAREVVEVRTVVFLSLPSASVVEALVADLTSHPGATDLPGIVDLSTTGVVGARHVAQVLAENQIRYAEAPVSGGVAGARNGQLTLMASGSSALLDDVGPLLLALGNVVQLGEGPGLGQAMKVLNNLLSGTNLAIASEAVAAGVAVGLDPAQMIQVFNSGSGKNSATLDKYDKYVLSGAFNQGFALPLMVKDVSLAQDLLHEVGLPAWVSAAVMETWLAASRFLSADADFTEMPKLHASFLSPNAANSHSIYPELS